MREVRYLAPPGVAWLHYLHGNVPGHQLDWICRPRGMPHGVTPQHVQHLLDLVQVHDVPSPGEVTLTFANLSLKDTTWRPGHGGLGVVAHFRIPASLDHGGRKNPRFVHSLVCVDQPLNAESIGAAVDALSAATLSDRAAPDRPVDWWYARYLAACEHGESTVLEVLESYFASFGRLMVGGSAPEAQRWALAEGVSPPREVRVRCGPRTPETWRDAVEAMVGLAALLYWSRVPWAAITTGAGRGGDDGTVIRFLFGPPSTDERELPLSNLPRDPEALALALLPLVLEEEPRYVSAIGFADPLTGAPRTDPGPVQEDAGVETVPVPPAFDPGEPVDVLGFLPPPSASLLPDDTGEDLYDGDDTDDEILETEGPVEPMDMSAPGARPGAELDVGTRETTPPLALARVEPEPPVAPVFTVPPELEPEPEAQPTLAPTLATPPPATSQAPPPPPPALHTLLPDGPTQVTPERPATRRPAEETDARAWLPLLLGTLIGLAVVAGLAWWYFVPKGQHGQEPPAAPVETAPSAPVEPPAAPVEPPAAPVEPPAAPATSAAPAEPASATTSPSSSAKAPSKAPAKAPSKAPAKAASATSAPAAPAPSGSVQVDPGGAEVRLGRKRLEAGANTVAAGSYELNARFPDLPDPISFGPVTVQEGGRLRVRCAATTYTCSVKSGE